MRLAETYSALPALLVLVAFLAACRTSTSYLEPATPRYAGGPGLAATLPPRDTLRVVSFNVEFARQVDGAIGLLSTDPELRDADIVLLQEMTAPSTERIAAALGMWWVYYPAIRSSRVRQDVGNAVLSRWPIVADAKVILPHRSRYAGTHRIATAATIALGADSIRVYSAHLGTPLDVSGRARRAQLRAIVADAERHPRVVLGGDLNDRRAGAAVRDAGYRWPTQSGPSTVRGLGRVDHVFLKGFDVGEPSSGTGPAAPGVSDHRAVWIAVPLRSR